MQTATRGTVSVLQSLGSIWLKGVVQAVNSNEPIDGEAGDKQGWRKSMSIETRGRTDLMIIGDYLEIALALLYKL